MASTGINNLHVYKSTLQQSPLTSLTLPLSTKHLFLMKRNLLLLRHTRFAVNYYSTLLTLIIESTHYQAEN